MAHKKTYVIENELPSDELAADATDAAKTAREQWKDDNVIVHCGMLQSMEAGLQKRFENFTAFKMLEELKTMFQTQARAERYEISDKFFTHKMEEGSSVSEHGIMMTGYIQRLDELECKIPEDLKMDRILQSLPPSFNSFVMNFNMQGMKKTVSELFAMLKVAEVDIKKEHQVLMVNRTTNFKKKGKKGVSKKGGKYADPTKKRKSGSKLETECYYCKAMGHWKRNCPKFIADKKAGLIKKGIYDILIDVIFLVLKVAPEYGDTNSVTLVCSTKQDLLLNTEEDQEDWEMIREEVTIWMLLPHLSSD